MENEHFTHVAIVIALSNTMLYVGDLNSSPTQVITCHCLIMAMCSPTTEKKESNTMRYLVRSIWIAMITIGVAASLATKAAAQSCPPPTFPDCNDTWIYMCYPVSVTENNVTCSFTVCFCYRHACNRWYDMVIQSITPDDPDCIATWTSTDLANLVADARLALLQKNPMGFPINPCPNPQSTTWRFVAGTCYYQDPIGKVLHPCDGAATCWEEWHICRRPDGTVEASIIHSGPAIDNCVPPAGGYCFPSCPTQ